MKLIIITSNDFFSKILISKIINNKNIDDLKIIKLYTPFKVKLNLFLKGFFKSPIYVLYLIYEIIIINFYLKKYNKELEVKTYSVDYTLTEINNDESIDSIKKENIDNILFIRPLQIIRKDFLDIFPNVYNLHNTMLPKYRGLGGIFQTLKHNEDELGLTIHKISLGIDSGDIVLQEKIRLIKNSSLFEVTLLSYIKSHDILSKFIIKLKNNSLEYKKQNEYESSLFSWPSFKDFIEYKKSKYKLFGIKKIYKIIGKK